MKKIKLKIEGMHCSSCAMEIDMDLEDVDGVESSKTSYARAETEVEFDQNKIAADRVLEKINETGYKAIIEN